MKRIKMINAIALIGVILVFGSCEKKLDLYPFNAIELSQSFKTVKDASTWNGGLYADLRGRIYGSYMFATDVQADQLNASLDFGNRNGNPHRWGQSFLAEDGLLSGIWSGYYFALRNVNAAIAGFETIPTATTAEGDSMRRFKSDCYFARAYYYHQLIQRYAKAYNPSTASTDLGVPLVLKYDINALPARASVKEVYDQILNDINTSKTLATVASARANSAGAMRVTTDAIAALEARVRLDIQDWPGAIAAANSVISSSRYPLINTLADLRNMWINDFPKEIIMRSAVVRSNENPNTNSIYLGFNLANNRFTPDFIPSQWVIDSYDNADIRKATYFGAKAVLIQGIQYASMTLVDKYPGNPALFTTAATNYQHTPIMFRVAELYLIVAEAGANAGGASATLALSRLNELRVARGLAPVASSGAALVQDVRDERTRELAFEGFRLQDLKRWGLGFTRRNPQTINAINVGDNYERLSVAANDPKFVWGIPINDLSINPNLVQNPGW